MVSAVQHYLGSDLETPSAVMAFQLGLVTSLGCSALYRRGMVHKTAYLLTATGGTLGHIAVRSAGNGRETPRSQSQVERCAVRRSTDQEQGGTRTGLRADLPCSRVSP